MVNEIKFCKQRHAFTMIELIFAIVIIGVSMLSIPMVMTQDARNQEDSLMQEGILLTATRVSQVLSFPWDINSSPPALGAFMSTSQVLETGGDNDFNRSGISDFRVGHFPEQLRRRLSPNSAPRNASAIGVGPNSISGQHGTSDNVGAVNGRYAYKKQWEVNTSVAYVSDNAVYAGVGGVINGFNFSTAPLGGGATSNIKMVQVTATDMTAGVTGNQVVLTSYSSNVGEAEFFKRRY